MREILKELLSDGEHLSSMRVMGFFALLIGSMLAFYGVAVKADLSELAILVGVFMGSAFGGKAIQSFSENKETKK